MWILLALVICAGLPFAMLPSARDYRTLIASAHHLELQYLPYPNCSRHFTMATVPGENAEAIQRLSECIRYQGLWIPFTDFSGNVYRIRVHGHSGSWQDVVVLGGNRLRQGGWCIQLSTDVVATIKDVVVRSGGRLPDNSILFNLLGASRPATGSTGSP